jgi:nucleoside 2-deoxyribosyltransferase
MTKPTRPEDCSLYVASPFGFSEAGREFYYGKFLPVIQNKRFRILDPWKLTPQEIIDPILRMPLGPEQKKAFEQLKMRVGSTNEKAIRSSNGIVAVLDGTDVDSGVAGEVSFGYGIGKTTLGYRNDFRLASENIGSKVNMQIEYFIIASDGKITGNLEELGELLIPTFIAR